MLRFHNLQFQDADAVGPGVSEGMFVVAEVIFNGRGHILAARLASNER